MATRRNVPSTSPEKTISQSQGGPPANSLISDTRPSVPSDVIVKLLMFTVAMIVVPIGSFFATVNVVFRGNATYAGGFAAFMANVVLVGYIIVAMREDQGDQPSTAVGVNAIQPQPRTKKAQ